MKKTLKTNYKLEVKKFTAGSISKARLMDLIKKVNFENAAEVWIGTVEDTSFEGQIFSDAKEPVGVGALLNVVWDIDCYYKKTMFKQVFLLVTIQNDYKQVNVLYGFVYPQGRQWSTDKLLDFVMDKGEQRDEQMEKAYITLVLWLMKAWNIKGNIVQVVKKLNADNGRKKSTNEKYVDPTIASELFENQT